MDAYDLPAAMIAAFVAIAFFSVARRNARDEQSLGRAGRGEWCIIALFASLAAAIFLGGFAHPFLGDLLATFLGVFIAAVIVLIAGEVRYWIRREPRQK